MARPQKQSNDPQLSIEIFEETEAERAKYTESEAEHMLTCLIFREIYKACNYEVK